MSDRHQDLRTFVAVVQAQGFQAAAGRLGLVKSAVSRRISDLEARLGTRLLHRTTQQISVTEAGEAFYWRSVKLLKDVRDAEEAAASAAVEATGLLRVTTTVAFANHRLAPVVGEFLHRHPRVRFELEATDGLVDMVETGHDVAIRLDRLTNSSLITRSLTRVRYRLAASPDYLRAHGRPGGTADLARHRWIAHRSMAPPLDGIAASDKEPFQTFATFDNEETMLRVVGAGGGLAFLPSYIVDPAATRGEIVTLLPELDRAVDMHILFPSATNLPLKVRTFIAFVVRRFACERPAAPPSEPA